MQALKGYLEQLQAVAQQSHATNELSYHGALEHLLRTLRPNLTVVREPTRTVVGRPDFAILHQHAPVGYVEAEAYAADLDNLPPHGGIAPGIDRLVMLLAGDETIRNVIAFPKNTAMVDLMFGAPSPASEEQLRELHLRIVLDDED